MEKGAIAGVGGLIMLAIAIIVGAILLQGSAQNTADVVNTKTLSNHSLATVVNGTAQYIEGYKDISNVVVLNQTGTQVIGAGNYTITNNVPYNGGVAIKIVPETPAAYQNAWRVSGTVQSTAYADSAGRSLTNLIIVMAALAMVAVAVGYAVKSYND